MGYAQKQEGKVSKFRLERNKNINTRSGYNHFMLDIVKDIDVVYTQYEELVQRVWDNKVDMDLHKTSGAPLKEMNNIRTEIVNMPIYPGGLEYRNSVLDYLEAVKQKIVVLEKFGILGADANSDIQLYYETSRKFQEADNVTIDKRNKVRRQKTIYERTAYVE
ncbi:hypothetical protein JCM30204_23750 [Dysgonomonas termitidis]